jgi:[ribosomal protein S5]-alanine N-acetyltransferase
LRSQSVYLRRLEANDFDELSARYGSSRKHFAGLAPSAYDRSAFDKMLAAAALEINESFLICRVEDEAIAGSINLSQIIRGSFHSCFMGYQLFEGFTGRGYMTDAVIMALGFAFREAKLHRVEANVQPQNASSIAVLQRCGFSKEGFSPKYLKIGGRWRDHERWAIIKEDWKPIRS